MWMCFFVDLGVLIYFPPPLNRPNSPRHTLPSSSLMKVSKLQCVLLLPAQASYKALIDCQQSEKILALTNGANVELEPIWATLLAKALEGKNVKELLSNVGSGGGAPAAGSGAPAAGGAAPAAEAPKEEAKKEEEKEESDDDMVRLGFSFCGYMFGMMLMFDLWLCRVSVCSINCTMFIMYMSFSTSSHISLAKIPSKLLSLLPDFRASQCYEDWKGLSAIGSIETKRVEVPMSEIFENLSSFNIAHMEVTRVKIIRYPELESANSDTDHAFPLPPVAITSSCSCLLTTIMLRHFRTRLQ